MTGKKVKRITWVDVEESKRWLLDYKDKIDSIVCILRGGSILSTIASHILDVPIYYIEFKSYDKRNKQCLIEYRNFSIDSRLEEKRVLVIDDVWDSGKTIKNTWKIVRRFYPKTIQTFVLVTKEPDKCDNLLVNFCIDCPKNVWCKFPWEV